MEQNNLINAAEHKKNILIKDISKMMQELGELKKQKTQLAVQFTDMAKAMENLNIMYNLKEQDYDELDEMVDKLADDILILKRQSEQEIKLEQRVRNLIDSITELEAEKLDVNDNTLIFEFFKKIKEEFKQNINYIEESGARAIKLAEYEKTQGVDCSFILIHVLENYHKFTSKLRAERENRKKKRQETEAGKAEALSKNTFYKLYANSISS